jgi:hypothetical protein
LPSAEGDCVLFTIDVVGIIGPELNKRQKLLIWHFLANRSQGRTTRKLDWGDVYVSNRRLLSGWIDRPKAKRPLAADSATCSRPCPKSTMAVTRRLSRIQIRAVRCGSAHPTRFERVASTIGRQWFDTEALERLGRSPPDSAATDRPWRAFFISKRLPTYWNCRSDFSAFFPNAP